MTALLPWPPGQRGGLWSGIRYRIDGKVPAGSRWLVRVTHAQLEWDALTPAQEQALRMPGYPNGFQQTLSIVPLGGPPPAGPSPMPNTGGGMIQTPYAAANHFLRLSGQLVQLATAQETVTFHNLNVRQQPNPTPPPGLCSAPHHRPIPVFTPPLGHEISARPQTVVTPSGVSVTLLPFSTLPQKPGLLREHGRGRSCSCASTPPPLGWCRSPCRGRRSRAATTSRSRSL